MAAARPSTIAVLATREAAHDWLQSRGAQRLVADSRRVRPGDAFIAWPGAATDARRHVPDALAAGAAACLVEAEGASGFVFVDAERVAAFRGLKAAAGDIASRFLGRPSRRLAVVAVTGTNGKTSTVWWTAQALALAGRRCGVIGTLGIADGAGDGDAQTPPSLRSTGLTTPDPITLQEALHDFAERGFAACAIEASSIGIVEHRLAGTDVAVAVFTNFTQDHLDYHGDMAAYWAAKAQLFAWPGLRAAIVNLDDAQGEALAASLVTTAAEVWTTSTSTSTSRTADARLRATDIRAGRDGLRFTVREASAARADAGPGSAGSAGHVVAMAVVGAYNVANALAVIAVLRALGVPLDDAAAFCSKLRPVPGRMARVQPVNDAAPDVIVDYAHTPDALEKALAALQPLAADRGGRLWCVFGCGGNRDAAKRPAMGAIAARLAARVVVTSDNPRLEAADFIIAQILAGTVGHDDVDVVEDRAEAIAHAIGSAAPADVVLIAGKGHEDYQDVGGRKLAFADAEHARAALAARGAS